MDGRNRILIAVRRIPRYFHADVNLGYTPGFDPCRRRLLTDDIESRYFVAAAAKALEVLESFDSLEEELSIMEVARRVGLTYSSTFRLLYTLEKRGYVMRRQGSRKYSRTPLRKRFRIGYAAADNHMRFSDEVSRSLVVAARNHGIDML